MKNSGLSKLAERTAPPPISWLMERALSRSKLISLAAGFTDHASLPVDEVRELMDELLQSRRDGERALQYSSTQGDLALREVTAEHLRTLDATVAHAQLGRSQLGNYSPDRMIVGNGSQQILYILTEALCDPGDIVLVEDPTYFVYLSILQSHGLRARTVRMQADGVDLEHLDAVLASLKRSGELRKLKVFYLVSYFQNPTGLTTSFEKKRRVLELLRRYERAAGRAIYLLEDAAYRELRFAGDDTSSALAARGAGERVIYAGTYSKPFATGTRVGFGILPEPLFTAALRIKGNHDFGTSNLLQQLLARAVASGRYERHLRALRRRYAEKAAVMKGALVKYFPASVEWREPAGGLYFWARLPRSVRSGRNSALFRAVFARDVLYVPGELCYADDPTRRKPDHELRLSFGSASERDIREGVRRLGGVLRNF